MNELIREWTQKADADYWTASREIGAEINPNWDAVCFHCEQSVEKMLKGLLQKAGVEFTKTHDLEVLLRLAMRDYPTLQTHMDGLKWLTVFSVAIRYPGESAAREDAEKSLEIATAFRTAVLPLFENE